MRNLEEENRNMWGNGSLGNHPGATLEPKVHDSLDAGQRPNTAFGD